jgi:hypothetical protein
MKVAFVAGLMAVAALSCSEVSGPHQTVHATPVQSDETWTRSGSPHLVQGRIFISGGATLTIEAGATVLFDTLSELVFGRTLIGTGTLRALGTAASPILFRSRITTAAPGYWAAIALRSNTTSELHYVDVSGCGTTLFLDSLPSGCIILGNPLLPAESPSLVVDHVTVHDAKGGAVILSNHSHFAPGSAVLTVSSMRGYVAKMPAGEASAFPGGGAFVGNDFNEVRLALDTLRDSTTWPSGIPWTVIDNVFVEGPNQPVLTILPNDTIGLRGVIVVGWDAPGGLRVGAENAPVVTLRAADTSWGGIEFAAHAIASSVTNTVLDNCGRSETAWLLSACVSVRGDYFRVLPDPAVALRHVTLRALETGLELTTGGRLGIGSTDLTIIGVSHPGTVDGFGPPISILGRSSPSSIPPGDYSGTLGDAILLTDVEVRRDDTFPNFGVPYLALFNGISVGDSTTHPTLTLLPGTTIQFGGARLSVGWDAPGNVRAIGTVAQPITLTGESSTPGVWLGVRIGNAADSSTLFDHVIVDYAGGVDFAAGSFKFSKDIGPVIRNSTISNSASCGVIIVNQPPWATDFTAPSLGNTFTNNAGGAVCGP